MRPRGYYKPSGAWLLKHLSVRDQEHIHWAQKSAPESPILQPWLEAGNTPDPAPTPEPPVPLTPAEKLAQSGLTVAELKALLGLKN